MAIQKLFNSGNCLLKMICSSETVIEERTQSFSGELIAIGDVFLFKLNKNSLNN